MYFTHTPHKKMYWKTLKARWSSLLSATVFNFSIFIYLMYTLVWRYQNQHPIWNHLKLLWSKVYSVEASSSIPLGVDPKMIYTDINSHDWYIGLPLVVLCLIDNFSLSNNLSIGNSYYLFAVKLFKYCVDGLSPTVVLMNLNVVIQWYFRDTYLFMILCLIIKACYHTKTDTHKSKLCSSHSQASLQAHVWKSHHLYGFLSVPRNYSPEVFLVLKAESKRSWTFIWGFIVSEGQSWWLSCMATGRQAWHYSPR